MRVLNYIRSQKESFKKYRSENMKNKKARYEAETKKKKKKEDYYKAVREKQKVKENIRSMRRDSYNNSIVGRVLSKGKPSKTYKSRSRTRGSKIINKQSSGIGSGFGSNINPAFSLGKEEKKEPKKRTTIIKIYQ